MTMIKKISPFVFLLTVLFSCKVEAPRITMEKTKELLGSKDVVILDVRTDKDYNATPNKIKGAIREQYKEFDSWKAKYPKDKKIILYCAWKNEGSSASLAAKYKKMGYPEVYALKGGWKAWDKAGYPVEKK